MCFYYSMEDMRLAKFYSGRTVIKRLIFPLEFHYEKFLSTNELVEDSQGAFRKELAEILHAKIAI